MYLLLIPWDFIPFFKKKNSKKIHIIFHIIGNLMIFKTFQKYINKSNLTFPFNKPLPSARNTLIVCSAVIIDPNNEWYEHIEEDTIEEWIWEILSDDKRKFFKSVVVRTSLLKYNYDFLLRSDIYHDYNKQNNHDIRFNPSQHKVTDGGIYYDEYHNIYSNRETAYLDYHLRSFRKPEYQNVAPFWIFIKTHLILLKGFLVLRLKDKIYLNGNSLSYGNKIKLYCQKVKKSFPIAEKAWKYYCYDNNPSTGKITNNKKTPSENSENINSVNLSNENNANSQDNPSQKNTSLIKSQNPEDVFAPYAHLWTYCKNCETSIYKQYAQKNKYICKHCAFHLPMESSDRIESLIDLGTWDPTDETLVSIDPYDEILRQRKKADSKVPPFFRGLLFLDDEDRLQRKDFDLSVIMDEFLERSGMKECTPDEILDRMFQLRDYLRRIAGVKDQDIKTFEELKLKKKLTKLSAIDRKKKTLEDLVNSLPSDKEELDIEGLDTEGPDTEKSTVEQTSTDTDQSTDTNQFTDTDQSTAEQSIAKKYTIKELVELFLLEERETKAELEKKEKNLASADNKDANQNSEKSTESEKDIETEKSTESEKDIETEKSTESEKDIESEEDIPYMNKVDFYQRETGLTDAVQTGIGQLDGIPVALAVMDFQFIGGSMGSVVGEKITRLIEYATYKSLPLIISCASGGARMQEGSFSLMQMAKISLALLDYQLNQKLLLVSLLTSPTTGGVTASFGMLGDLIIGEPDAYIAFAGKRVIEEVMKIELPEGVQEAEYLFEKGSLDLIVPRNLLKGVLSELLKLHGFFPLNENKILNLTSRYKILYGDLPLYGQLPRSK